MQKICYLSGMFENLIRGIKATADLLLPRRCVVCGQRLNVDERHICMGCLDDLPLTHYWGQRHNPMADRFNGLVQKGLDGKDDSRTEHYVYAAALFFYDADSSYSRITQRLKYNGDIPSGRFFGQLLGRMLASAEHFSDVDMVIPVPLHKSRRRKRGYNQAEVIAAEVARELAADMRTDILTRRRKTRTQTALSVEEKAHNVHGAFAVTDADISTSGHILLIDDVFTTGSTLHACLTALRMRFPDNVRISVATSGVVGS